MWGALSDETTGLSFTTYSIFTFYMLSCVIHSLTYSNLSYHPHTHTHTFTHTLALSSE
jgi:hypothetical protein